MKRTYLSSFGLVALGVCLALGAQEGAVSTEAAALRARALGILRSALTGTDSQRAALALDYIRTLAAPWGVEALKRAVQAGDPSLRVQALVALVEDHPAQARGLLGKILRDPHQDALLRQVAADKLPTLKDGETAALLRPLLEDPDPTLRILAAGGLLEIGDPSGLARLRAHLHGDDLDLRVDAASELLDARFEEDQALAALARVLANRGEPIARSNAAYALGETHHPEALSLLLRALEDADRGVRVAAANSLALKWEQTGSTRATPVLLEMALRDPDYLVRLEAIHGLVRPGRDRPGQDRPAHDGSGQESTGRDSLGEAESGDIIRTLRRVLSDRVPSVRLAAAAALGSWGLRGDEELVALAREELESSDYTLRLAALSTLGRIGDESTAFRLKPFLADPDAMTRLAAALAIHRILARIIHEGP